MNVFKFLYCLKKVELGIGCFVCAGSRYENYKKVLSSLIVIIFLRMRVAVTSLLRDKLPPF
jgi:hypothetical protein